MTHTDKNEDSLGQVFDSWGNKQCVGFSIIEIEKLCKENTECKAGQVFDSFYDTRSYPKENISKTTMHLNNLTKVSQVMAHLHNLT